MKADTEINGVDIHKTFKFTKEVEIDDRLDEVKNNVRTYVIYQDFLFYLLLSLWLGGCLTFSDKKTS